MDNLELYNKYADPPKSALRSFDNGRFKGTDINPMWRIRALTEEFGPCGIGWYTEVVRQWREDCPDGTCTVYCHIHLYIKVNGEWSMPIVGIGGNTLARKAKSGLFVTDEAYKMAYTDALGIACKALGIGASIWWQCDQTKYTAYDIEPESEVEPDPEPEVKTKCEECRETVTDYTDQFGKVTKAAEIASKSVEMYGKCLCGKCMVTRKSRKDAQFRR